MSLNITGHTQLACLLGRPVGHSISPAMHNAAFDKLGIDCAYLAFDVKPEDLSQVAQALKTMNVLGFNLTMPLKNTILPLCDEISDAARISGSVNTVVNDHGHFVGHTTDGIGFMLACKEAGFDPMSGKMVLLGAGGAAASILVQAALDGVPAITVFNRPGRSYDSISSIIDILNKESNCHIKLLDYSDMTVFKRELQEASLLVNASSVGMAPDIDSSLIPDPSYLHPELNVYDIIYNPFETKLMKQAKEAGCKTDNGRFMLLYQGAAAFKKWTGTEMPVPYIKDLLF